MTRTVAVDWSGDRRAETRPHPRLWAAEVVDGVLVRMWPSSRRQIMADVLAVADADPDLVVGLDFSFSLPEWFLDQLGVASAPRLWERAPALLAEPPEPPFFGRAGTRRPPAEQLWRRTEVAAADAGLPVKSSFQLSGPGSVGTGSLRGMPHLATLRASGVRVWPFDDPPTGGRHRPLAVEIYPRLFTGAVVKSRPVDRATAWAALAVDTEPGVADTAVSSEDAFDAAVSAVVMDRRLLAGAAAAPVGDAAVRREGWIWGIPPPR